VQHFPITEEQSDHIEWQMTTQILGIFKSVIEETGMTKAEIAREMEWSEIKLYYMLKGVTEWSLRDVGEMAYVLGIEIDLEFIDPLEDAA
jgi:hypothetical protein